MQTVLELTVFSGYKASYLRKPAKDVREATTFSSNYYTRQNLEGDRNLGRDGTYV